MSICNNYEALISAKMDNALSAEEEHALEKHLEKCSVCRAKMSSYQSLKNILKHDTPPRSLPNENTAHIAFSDIIRKKKRGEILARSIAAIALIVVGIGALTLTNLHNNATVSKATYIMYDDFNEQIDAPFLTYEKYTHIQTVREPLNAETELNDAIATFFSYAEKSEKSATNTDQPLEYIDSIFIEM